MLRLFRKHPDVIPAPDWAERITNIIDDYDLGVCLSVTSLITALAQQYPEAFMMAIPKAIMRLHKVYFSAYAFSGSLIISNPGTSSNENEYLLRAGHSGERFLS